MKQKCPFLHSQVDYSIRAYPMRKQATKRFKTWFEKVFSAQQPNAAKDFDVRVVEDEDGPLLEVMQYNIAFSIDSLESMFYAAGRESSQVTANIPDPTSKNIN